MVFIEEVSGNITVGLGEQIVTRLETLSCKPYLYNFLIVLRSTMLS